MMKTATKKKPVRPGKRMGRPPGRTPVSRGLTAAAPSPPSHEAMTDPTLVPPPSPTIMADAVGRERREQDSRGTPNGAMADVMVPMHETPTIPPIAMAPAELDEGHFDDAAFFEEPVEIVLHPPAGEMQFMKFVPCQINGAGPEILVGNRWVVTGDGHFPIGPTLITKRKYVDQLARSRQDTVDTVINGRTEQYPKNILRRVPTMRWTFTVTRDSNPKRGQAWLSGALSAAI